MAKFNLEELGDSGLERYSGHIFEEFMRQLKKPNNFKVFKEMSENDPTIGAFLYAVEYLTHGVNWWVNKASEDKADVEAAEFLESCMYDMEHTWNDFISEVLTMLVYGYAPHEVVYKYRLGRYQKDKSKKSKYNDGRLGWRKIPIRAPETVEEWIFSDNGEVEGFIQVSPPQFNRVTIPSEKLLIFRTTKKKNNPEGRSVLRNAFRPWYMKKKIENTEGVGIERDLAGLPLAEVPPYLLARDAKPEHKAQLQAIKKIVTNIRRDEQEGVVFPMAYDEEGRSLFKLSLLSTGGNRQFDTDKTIKRYRQDIAMSVLSDFILIGHEATGSFALSSTKTNLFIKALSAWLDLIASTINEIEIPRLFALNNFDHLKAYPEIMHGDVAGSDLDEIGKFITALANAGAPLFPNKELENYLYSQANFPVTEE